nr:hypothetical protein [Tanacetum cinerariifolium]
MVVRVEKKLFVIEQPISPAPLADTKYLRSGMQFMMLIMRLLVLRSEEEEKPVGPYVIKMKNYVAQLERLGYVLPQDISVGLILNGLTSDFAGFVRNYNKHKIGKTISQLHALLIKYEKGLSKKAATPQVMAIQGGRYQKDNKKSFNAKGKGKGQGKGKDKSYIPKLKNPKPFAKEHPTQHDTCHHCKEAGHCKRNFHAYHAELIKKKKQVGTGRSLDIFVIELFSFPTKSWVYDTSCGTYICNTKHGLRGVRKLKQVEVIGSFDLVLPNGLVICLDNCHYAPTITRGVILVSRLVDNGFIQCFMDYEFSDSKNNVLYLMLLQDYALETATRVLNMVQPRRYAKFIKKNLISQEVNGRAVDIKEIQDEDISPSENTSKILIEVEGFEPPQEELILVLRNPEAELRVNYYCNAGFETDKMK